ncbi:MAG: glycoside hydrolase family 19 protein [Pseudomonadota bacterium]|nr:glycoside hydrolase family 19 protein [Pseudomonadota bacterium]
MITDGQLAAALRCPLARAAAWGSHLRTHMAACGINTPRRLAHFLAQIGHESAGLHLVTENLNYSAQRLVEVFPRYFSAATAPRYARQPAAIANRVYANRMGNGPEHSGDGWRYRGRSPIQLTGHDNYRAMQRATGLPLLATPDIAAQPEAGSLIACTWWRDNGLNHLADQDDVLAVSRRVNLGTTQTTRTPNGYADRVTRTGIAAHALGVR